MYSVKNKLHGRKKAYKPGNLRTIALDVTPKCNMKCHHCYAETFVKVKPIELDILKKALDEFYALGVFHYVLQGGEPIADPNRLEAILKMCYPNETYINVVSNGWDMTKDRVIWLKDLKVDKIAFSLDSGIEKEHDIIRGEGSYKRVLDAIDYVLEEGLLTSISIVVTHESLYSEGFKNAYEYAKNKKIKMDIQIAEPVGKWDGKKEFLVTPEDSKYIKRLQLNSLRLPNGQRMINRDIFCGDRDHCPAGIEFMGLTADGHFLPCNFLQFSLGNISDKSIKEMRDNLLTSAWFRGDYPNCLCGENQEFINKYIIPYKEMKKPLNAYKIFGLKENR